MLIFGLNIWWFDNHNYILFPLLGNAKKVDLTADELRIETAKILAKNKKNKSKIKPKTYKMVPSRTDKLAETYGLFLAICLLLSWFWVGTLASNPTDSF